MTNMDNPMPQDVMAPQGAMHELRDRAKAIVCVAALGVAALAGCGSAENHSSATTTSTTTSTVEAPSTTTAKKPGLDLESGVVHAKTDQELASGGYNCGHTLDKEQSKTSFDYGNQIDYLNEKPELAKNLIDFQVNDPRWGMGKKAWEVVTKQALTNADTPRSQEVAASKDMDIYSHKTFTTTLPEAHDYVNFTCSDAEGNVTPVTAVEFMKLTGTVDGFVFNEAGLKAFEKVVKRGPSGEMMFDVIALEDKKVTKDGKTVTEERFMVVTESRGCLNPNRKIPPTTKIETPGTTVPGTTPPNTYPPTTVGIPPKHDNGEVPGPGTGRGTVPNTPPTPDNGSQNPVGGTLPPTGPPSTEAPGTTVKPTNPNTVPGSTTPPPPVG